VRQLTVKPFLAHKCISVLKPPPPPPPFTRICPLWLLPFPKLRNALKGTHFQSVDEVK
jgi:hypothetical protein